MIDFFKLKPGTLIRVLPIRDIAILIEENTKKLYHFSENDLLFFLGIFEYSHQLSDAYKNAKPENLKRIKFLYKDKIFYNGAEEKYINEVCDWLVEL